ILVLVSHDRYLIDKLTEQLFIFEGNGRIRFYNGNYADYKSELEESIKTQKQQEKENTKDTVTPVQSDKRKLSYKEQLEYNSLEEEITQLEEEIKRKEFSLWTTSDYDKLAATANAIQLLKESLDNKSERWLELSEFA